MAVGLRAAPVVAVPDRCPGLDDMYPATARAVGAARGAVTAWLRAHPVAPAAIGDVALALSEACTNVVVHAYRDRVDASGSPVTFRVVADREGRSVRVTVSDAGGGMAPRADSPGLGLGLPVIAALTERLEVSPAPGGRGTVVSMVFAAPLAGPATG
jgi:serine/threonine-protein kinase RsbW